MSRQDPPLAASVDGGRQRGALRKQGLITAEAAAELLAVPKSWVLAEARANRIPHIRLGRYVRFEPEALEGWWQSRRRGPWRARGTAATAAGYGPATPRREAGS